MIFLLCLPSRLMVSCILADEEERFSSKHVREKFMIFLLVVESPVTQIRFLMFQVAGWANDSWLQGAVNELEKFSKMPIPDDVLDKVEYEDDYPAFLDWLDKVVED